MLKKYGSKIVIGVDAKDEKVAVEGWLEKTETADKQCSMVSSSRIPPPTSTNKFVFSTIFLAIPK
jgi:hypothetical protein